MQVHREVLHPRKESRWYQRPAAQLATVAVIALAARLPGIASRPIWYDEAFSILFAEKGPAAMFAATFANPAAAASEVHPLGYYVILWQWMKLFGESLVSVRALSVVAGVATVIAVFTLSQSMFGRTTALAAGVVTALAPFQVHYGQEIRMYGYLALWLLLATYCYWQGSRLPQLIWWAGFAAFAALAESTQYLAVFYLAALAAWPLITRKWRLLRNTLAAASLAVLLCIPWLVYLPGQLARISRTYWIGRPGPSKLLTLLLTYVTNLPLPGWMLAVGLFVSLALVVMAAMQTIRAVRGGASDAQLALWVVYLAAVPPVLMLVFSQWIPVYLERALLPSGAIFCIWIAWSLTRPNIHTLATGLIVALVLAGFSMGLYEHVTYAGFPYAAFDEVAAELRDRLQPGDVIIHSSKLSLLPTAYFDRSLPETFIADPPGSPVDTLSQAAGQELGVYANPDIASAAGSAQRVWYVLFDESNKEYVQAGYPRHPDLTWLMQKFQPGGTDHWGELSVYLFSRGQ